MNPDIINISTIRFVITVPLIWEALQLAFLSKISESVQNYQVGTQNKPTLIFQVLT